jgi:phosphatidylglycerophosphate synthase
MNENRDITSSGEPIPTEVQDHILNIPNAMTASRAFALGPLGAKMLISGERGVTPIVAAMAASDAEGKVARAIDKRSIESTGKKNGYGTTELGKSIDPVADTVGFLEIAAAALKSPRTSALGKVAVGIVLAQESVKSGWAVRADKAHRKATVSPEVPRGEKLVLDVTKTGKRATGAKFAALSGAVLTHDLEPGKARTAAGVGAVASAVAGAVLGERARYGYNENLKSKGIDTRINPLRRRSHKAA